MAVIDDLAEARRQHKPSLALFRAQVEQRRQEIEQETSTANDIKGELGTLFMILDDLAKIGLTPFGYAMLERELNERNTRTALNIKLVLTELIERRKGGDLS